MRNFERKSPFEFDERYISRDTENVLFHQHLLPWAGGLRGNHILDLGGGAGIEAKLLEEIGYDVCLVDLSYSMLRASAVTKKIQADAELLPLPEGVFFGVIFKDIWIFLSPSQRENVLTEMHRVLRKKGSVFLMSQYGSVARIHYIPKDSKYPQKATCDTFDKFLDSYKKLEASGDHIFSIEHISTVEDTVKLANELGFKAIKSGEYSFDSDVSKQNRWVNRSGFIVELQKVR
jgi:ubiquinone/menaquinone biosynthesis C-methylase UbiE